MRLIDADALIESLTVDPIGCAGCPEPEFMDELIDILDTAPTVEPQGDLISRADAIEAVRKCVVESELLADWNKAMESAQGLLSELPSAEAVQGEWIFNAYEKTNKSWFECSVCGSDYFHKHNYCPNCGARMKGAKND